MSGDIKEKLLSSDAVKSLRMEHDIYSYLKSLGLKPSHSWYYKDIETRKLREIDIYVMLQLEKPRRHRYLGAPQVGIDIFIECKTAASHNILLANSPPGDMFGGSLRSDWFGFNHYLYDVAKSTLDELGIDDEGKMMDVYQYFKERAYPFSKAIISDLKITKPPVEVITTAFRDTKAGRADTESTSDQVPVSPLWNAIRATKSAAEAAKVRFRETQLGWISAHKPKFEGRPGVIESISFFFDAEIMRPRYFYPVVFTESKLWFVQDGDIREVSTARIHIEDADHDDFSVDVVSAGHAKAYLAKAIQHFERQSEKSIRKLWNTLEEIDWYPASNAEGLSQILGIALKDDAPENADDEA